jgi:hypothetical protein
MWGVKNFFRVTSNQAKINTLTEIYINSLPEYLMVLTTVVHRYAAQTKLFTGQERTVVAVPYTSTDKIISLVKAITKVTHAAQVLFLVISQHYTFEYRIFSHHIPEPERIVNKGSSMAYKVFRRHTVVTG